MRKSSDPLTPDEEREKKILDEISKKYIEIRKLVRELEELSVKEGTGHPETEFISDTYLLPPDRQSEVDRQSLVSLPFERTAAEREAGTHTLWGT